MTEISHTSLIIPAEVDPVNVVGSADAYLRELERALGVRIFLSGNRLEFSGDKLTLHVINYVLSDLIKCSHNGVAVDKDYVRHLIDLARSNDLLPDDLRNDIILTHKGKVVRPKTVGQKNYVDSIRNNTLTFGIGAAGTGKTYLAVACALAALHSKQVGRIVLSRPIVEAGENLGFLPGTLMEKVDPYMRPLYDALYDMDDFENVNQLIASNVIEIVPLAFMRGRTLNDSFIILDEAQNTTPEQMKMFLTRLGFGSKMVVTGDDTQIDLQSGRTGIKDIRRILDSVDDIAFCDFSRADVVRHSLVRDIVAAYEADSKNIASRNKIKRG